MESGLPGGNRQTSQEATAGIWVGTDENLNHWDGGRGDRWEGCSRGGTGSEEEGRSGMTLECLA